MEEYIIKKEYNEEEGEAIDDHREYYLINDNIKYVLRIEIIEDKINFIISLNDNIEYNYKTNMNLTAITNKLALNPQRYSDIRLI